MDFWTFFNDTMNNEGTYHTLLLLLLLEDDETEKFLNADNFKEGVENDGRKKFIINELERAKNDFREFNAIIYLMLFMHRFAFEGFLSVAN